MANICLKIRAIKSKTHINQAHKHNNIPEATALVDHFKDSKKRFSQDITNRIKTLRDEKKLERKFSKNEIELAEIVFTGSPEWFRKKVELPEGWRNLNDEEKAKLWQKHKADPQKVEQFKKTALKMLKEQFPDEAIINVVLHDKHETTPHIHALLIPMTKPEQGKPSRLSYEKIFGQAKGKKEKDGFEEWQDKAEQYFAPIGLERGQRGSLSVYKAPKQWNEETQEARNEAKKEADALKRLVVQKALIDRYGNRSTNILNSKEDNRKIAQAKKLIASGLTSEILERQIVQKHYNTAKKAKTEQTANQHLRAEKQRATEQNARRKADEQFSKMYEKAKKKDPEQAEKALNTLIKLATPEQKLSIAVAPGPDLKTLSRPTPRIATTYEQSQNNQPTQQEESNCSSFDDLGEGDIPLPKAWDKMTKSEQLSWLKAKQAKEERENKRREMLAKMRPKPQ